MILDATLRTSPRRMSGATGRLVRFAATVIAGVVDDAWRAFAHLRRLSRFRTDPCSAFREWGSPRAPFARLHLPSRPPCRPHALSGCEADEIRPSSDTGEIGASHARMGRGCGTPRARISWPTGPIKLIRLDYENLDWWIRDAPHPPPPAPSQLDAPDRAPSRWRYAVVAYLAGHSGAPYPCWPNCVTYTDAALASAKFAVCLTIEVLRRSDWVSRRADPFPGPRPYFSRRAHLIYAHELFAIVHICDDFRMEGGDPSRMG